MRPARSTSSPPTELRAGTGSRSPRWCSVSADTPQPTLLVCIHHSQSRGATRCSRTACSASTCCARIRRIFPTASQAAAARAARAKFDCARWTTQVTGRAARGRCAGRVRLPRHRERAGRIAFRRIRVRTGHFHRGWRRAAHLREPRLRRSAAVPRAGRRRRGGPGSLGQNARARMLSDLRAVHRPGDRGAHDEAGSCLLAVAARGGSAASAREPAQRRGRGRTPL